MSARTAASAASPRTGNVGRCVDGGPGLGDLPPAEFEAEAPRAQAAPEASEGPAIDSRPLRSPARLIQAASASCHREDDCGPVDAFWPVGVACSPVVAAM